MSLSAGSSVGPYEILDRLGAGGMGEVYRARDTRLRREVALKVLPPELAASAERLKRFEREARAASSLNHPHIVVVHDVGRDSGVDYLVMELVEGETLAARLARGPLAVSQAVELGRQLCSALEASHSKGVVHRDLKPGNVMLTRGGAKLLDFGLAAAVAPLPHEASSEADTLSNALTREGAILGTPQYMAPEQLRGESVDARTDIFALGALLYEAVTGRRAFEGKTRVDVAQAILGGEPEPPSSVRADVSPELDELLRHCLAKDPEDRYRSAHDVGLALAGIGGRAGVVARTGPSAGAGISLRWWIAIAAAAAGFTGLGIGWLAKPDSAPPGSATVRFQFMPPAGHEFVSTVETVTAAPSPDGSRIAFIARALSTNEQEIWVREIDDLDARRVAGTEGANSLMWSPNGRELAFFTGGQLRRVAVEGGGSVPICEIVPGVWHAGSWGAEAIVFTSVQDYDLYRVAPEGGEPEVLLRAEASEGRPVFPSFLPDGRGLLYLLIQPDASGLLMLWRPDSEPRVVAPMTSRVDYASTGWLVFAREAVLLTQAFDPEEGVLSGSPAPLAPAVPYFMSTFWAEFSASASGTVVYQSERPLRRLAWFDRAGREVAQIASPGAYLNVTLSASGKRLLFDRAVPSLGTYDVWSLDLERGVETRLTSSPVTEAFPLLMPDDQTLIYSFARGGAPALTRRDPRGTETQLVSSGGFEIAQDVSPDGRWLAFAIRAAGRAFHLWSLDLTSAEPAQRLLDGAFGQWSASFSPDGRHLAFVSDESGSAEAYVMPLHSPAERVRISQGGAVTVRWSTDGREVFVLSPQGVMSSVPVRTEPILSLESPTDLFTATAPAIVREVGRVTWLDFDVTPDGPRFVAVVPVAPDTPPRLSVVVGELSSPP